MSKIHKLGSMENVDTDNLIRNSINGKNGKTKLRTTYHYSEMDDENSKGYVGEDVYE